jgi:hypothetical protein
MHNYDKHFDLDKVIQHSGYEDELGQRPWIFADTVYSNVDALELQCIMLDMKLIPW